MAKNKQLTVPELIQQFEALKPTEQVQVFTAQKKILEDQKKQKVDDINLYQNAGIE